jgi:hypothetical protein
VLVTASQVLSHFSAVLYAWYDDCDLAHAIEALWNLTVPKVLFSLLERVFTKRGPSLQRDSEVITIGIS